MKGSRDGRCVDIVLTAPWRSGNRDAIANVKIGETDIRVGQLHDRVLADENFVLFRLGRRAAAAATAWISAATTAAATARLAVATRSRSDGFDEVREPGGSSRVRSGVVDRLALRQQIDRPVDPFCLRRLCRRRKSQLKNTKQCY